MPRDTGAVTESDFNAHEIEYWEFVKIELSTGTLFLTDKPKGFTGVIGDNASTTWSESDFDHSPLKQSKHTIFTVNWISFIDVNQDWMTRVYQEKIRNIKLTIYTAWFNTTTGAKKDSYPTFYGRFDDGEFTEEAKITLKPHHTPWDTPVPFTKMGGKCTNSYRCMEDCQYTGPEPVDPLTGLQQLTCSKTRYDCRLRANEIHINIYDDMPKPGEQFILGGIVRILKIYKAETP